MAQPITVKGGTCFAFPDMLLTPVGSSSVPMPYPNVAQLADAVDTATNVTAGGKAVILEASSIKASTGGEPGTNGGAKSGAHLGPCTFTTASSTVRANGQGVVRQGDTTAQNDGNAVGTVLAGVPTVLVGG